MKFYDDSGLDLELSKNVNDCFHKVFIRTSNKLDANIVLCGITPVKGLYYPNAKYFVCNCTNINHIDAPSDKIIYLDNTSFLKDVTATAEHTIYLMLNLLRPFDRITPGCQLKDKGVAIIGYGRIGKMVFDRLMAFGAAPIAFDKGDDLSLISQADIVSLHTTIEKNQPPILGYEEINMLKNGAYVVNTSRGEAINEEHLLRNMHRLGGFATDCLCGEPYPPNFKKFEKFSNFVYTPHIAGFCYESLRKTSKYCFDKLMGAINENDESEVTS